MNLPTLPFGGLLGIGMVITSFFVKEKNYKDGLFWGGAGVWGYHIAANVNNNPDFYQRWFNSGQGQRIRYR